jgi:hypothetical protein
VFLKVNKATIILVVRIFRTIKVISNLLVILPEINLRESNEIEYAANNITVNTIVEITISLVISITSPPPLNNRSSIAMLILK